MDQIVFYDEQTEENKNSLTISSYAFQSCSSLISIKLPNNLYNLDEYCFKTCENLENITFYDFKTEIKSFFLILLLKFQVMA